MFNHASENYQCPICIGIQGTESEGTLLKQADRVYSDQLTTAFINSFWVGKNKGHVIVVPNTHIEHIYDLPLDTGNAIFATSKKLAIAMKNAYGCDGVTIRQNNEPAGDQHALHYHLHIFPRYENDNFNSEAMKEKYLSKPEERVKFAKEIKALL